MLPLFWDWFLQYSSFFLTAALSFLVSYLIYLIGTRRPNLIWYASNPQLIPLRLPPANPQAEANAQPLPQATHVGTASVFLYNAGRAPARDVFVGHFGVPPANGVLPDIPRENVNLPGGGTAIRFPVIPPKVTVSISYLMFPPLTAMAIEQIVSYVGSEDGYARRIPVMVQRVFPRWLIVLLWVLLGAGVWVAFNGLLTLIVFLWRLYYQNS
jgi:hypothetical protein